MAQIEPRTLQGFSDYLPAQMRVRQYVADVWRRTFEKYGYGQLETPVLEYSDVLMGKYGEEERLIYHFKDHGDRHVAMRYDQTVPLARVVAQHRSEINLPFKRYEINRVWRAEAARRGRKREFYQCDADVIGTNSLLADAETILVLHDGFSQFGLPAHVINVSHRGVLEAFLESLKIPDEKKIEVTRSVDKLDKVGLEGVEKELRERGVPEAAIPAVLEFIGKEGSNEEVLGYLEGLIGTLEKGKKAVADLHKLLSYCQLSGVPGEVLKLNLTLVRGLDYYTGVVFELTIAEYGKSSLAGGGRYDNLCSMFTDEQISGVGFAVGFERLCLLMEEQGISLSGGAKGTEVLVSVYNEELLSASLAFCKESRSAGFVTELFFDYEEGKLGPQFKYADKQKIPLVVIFGPDEKAKNMVTLKIMPLGEQEEGATGGLVERVHFWLGRLKALV